MGNSRPIQRKRSQGKANKARKALQQQAAQTGMALMNMRQMYEQSVAEKNELEQQIARKDALIAALVLSHGSQLFVLKQRYIDDATSGDFTGFDIDESPEGLKLTMVLNEDWDDEESD